MKHILSYILALGLLTAGPVTTVSAQDYTPVPVTVSKDKVRVDGKLYYSHIVLERQTVYSICKAYNVTEEQIYAINPTVRTEGLKKNAVILIPCPEKEAVQARDTEQAPKKRAERKAEKKQTVHTVKWYEDLDTIAEKYGVSVEVRSRHCGIPGKRPAFRQRQPARIRPGRRQESVCGPYASLRLQRRKAEKRKHRLLLRHTDGRQTDR